MNIQNYVSKIYPTFLTLLFVVLLHYLIWSGFLFRFSSSVIHTSSDLAFLGSMIEPYNDFRPKVNSSYQTDDISQEVLTSQSQIENPVFRTLKKNYSQKIQTGDKVFKKPLSPVAENAAEQNSGHDNKIKPLHFNPIKPIRLKLYDD